MPNAHETTVRWCTYKLGAEYSCCGFESAVFCLLLCLLRLFLRSNEALNFDDSAAAHTGDATFFSPQRQ